MIHVCFPLHDEKGTYSKYEGTAIQSLLANTSSKIHVHILHDDTVCIENRERLSALVGRMGQRISLHEVSPEEFTGVGGAVKDTTIGTLFRLKMPEVLPPDVDRVIYLDADLVVHMDIRKLWDMDLGGASIAACRDSATVVYGMTPWPCKAGMMNVDSYFNAGVMLIDLGEIRRKYNLYRDCMEFLWKHPDCRLADQDAMNVIFKDRIFFLDPRFNTYTKFIRGTGLGLEERIYHFAGDYVNMEEPESFDRLFFQYLWQTPWATKEAMMEYFAPLARRKAKQMSAFQCLVKKLASIPSAKRIVFGASGILIKPVLRFFPMESGRDYFVDNNPDLHGTSVDGFAVRAPSRILEECSGSFAVMVISKEYYPEIREQLAGWGLKENEDFFDGRLLLTQAQGGYG